MEDAIKQILNAIGENPDREGLRDTPHRVNKSLRHLTRGYTQNIEDVINGAIFTAESDDMIIVKNIEFYSMCEHHMLPFFGQCHIGYIPRGKILGVSKLARLIDVFARRLQIQERLTHQVAKSIMEALGCEGVGVVMEAQHMCMLMRGVEKQNSIMTTSAMLGSFRKVLSTRSEFLQLIKG